MTKKLELLRPVDPTKLQFGDTLYITTRQALVTYVAGPDLHGMVCATATGVLVLFPMSATKLAPICWIEDKPVYQGDTVYFIYILSDEKVAATADYMDEDNYRLVTTGGSKISLDKLTLVKPPVKHEGWINIYPNNRAHPEIFKTQADADASAYSTRIDRIRIEWME